MGPINWFLTVLFGSPDEEELARREKEKRVAVMVALYSERARTGCKNLLLGEVHAALENFTEVRIGEDELRSVLDRLVTAEFVSRVLNGESVYYMLTEAGEAEIIESESPFVSTT